MYNLRPYQQECIDAIWRNLDKHCVASLPTGAGKSPCLAELIRRFMEYPDTYVLLLTHKRELIRQNAETLAKHLPWQMEIGIYCAGLRSKQLKQITIASVQSIVNACTLPDFELILVDEAHLLPHKANGQYHAVFARFPHARIIGLTATPYRMDGGLLHKGKEKLFDALVYEAKTGDLIEQGYLSPIISKAVSEHADLSEVHTRCGEYALNEMAAAMDKDRITAAAVKDVLTRAEGRESILVFCAGVEHAHHVMAAFKAAGQTSVAVISEETSMHERDELIVRFKTKSLRILINVGVFTTGFDYPGVDCVVLLRATQSPGLYVQMVGRGLRKAEGKTNCLLLDYGNNIETHGPLDMITVASIERDGVAPTKTCPQCESIIFAGFKECPDCGYVFPEPDKKEIKHGTRASEVDPIKPITIEDVTVKDVIYERHAGKDGKKDTLRVTYVYGLFKRVSEWICPEHTGWAAEKAQAWFARRGVTPMPKTIEDALKVAPKLLVPATISIKTGGKYPEIVRHDFSKLLTLESVFKDDDEEENNLPF